MSDWYWEHIENLLRTYWELIKNLLKAYWEPIIFKMSDQRLRDEYVNKEVVLDKKKIFVISKKTSDCKSRAWFRNVKAVRIWSMQRWRDHGACYSFPTTMPLGQSKYL